MAGWGKMVLNGHSNGEDWCWTRWNGLDWCWTGWNGVEEQKRKSNDNQIEAKVNTQMYFDEWFYVVKAESRSFSLKFHAFQFNALNRPGAYFGIQVNILWSVYMEKDFDFLASNAEIDSLDCYLI